MSSGMQIDTAELAGLAAEGGLYGVFVCLYFVCGYDLTQRRARFKSQLSWPMVLAGTLLIILATARFAVDTTNVFVAFIHHDPRAARLAYLADVTQPLFTTKHSLLIAVLLVGDSFVASTLPIMYKRTNSSRDHQNYRCWVVWGKNLWIVVVPIGLSFTSAAAGSYTMWAYSHLPNQTVLSEAKWLKAFFSLSLVANAFATSHPTSGLDSTPAAMLAFRIWSVDRSMKTVMEPGRKSRLSPIVRIVLESGLLNAAYLFVYVMTLEFGSEGLEIMSEMAVPLTGIIFSIVILRVGHQRHDDTYYTQRPATISWAVAKRSVLDGTQRTGGTGTTVTAADSGIMPMEVYIQRKTTDDTEHESHMSFSDAM
ncbi:hypothetical protein PYCCODRAFT_1425172 [Trametes coccinea BRFM310]|uniref:Uncharacterized protein n=1 Tax=Trametes coccinea (strain BRFM310) TaxID=1353009 RepID=A0A1Y2IQU7_TRAC3|nr:hypothetical protein PYCCODRAFT_1425172 [Trametes coccinea BRFM310]